MLLQALNEFYARATSEGKIDEAAFNPKTIRWIIPLDREGNLEGEGLIETTGEGKNAKIYAHAPYSNKPNTGGGVAQFLVDNAKGVFGIDNSFAASEASNYVDEKEAIKRARQDSNLKAKCQDFWRQIADTARANAHPAFEVLLKFAEHHGVSASTPFVRMPTFLRFGVSPEAKPKEKPCWWIKSASGKELKLGNDNFTFQVDGELLISEPPVQDYWRNAYALEVNAEESSSITGLCLVTGKENVPIMLTHRPKISGIPNMGSTGALLVSFEGDSFRSYGFKKSYNAPVSSQAVTAYTNGLNYLLRQRDHTLTFGSSAFCFWAKQSDSLTSQVSSLLNRPRPESVRNFLLSPRKGEESNSVKNDRFYSVVLNSHDASGTRIIVRHWLQITVEQAKENFQRWFSDLDIVTLHESRKENDMPLSLRRLALTTVREKKDGQQDKDLISEIASQLYRAALEGSKPPLIVAKKIIDRLTVDLAKEGISALDNLSRFALLKLTINRNRKEGDFMIEPTLAETNDTAYNCGRLLAIFDDLQYAAQGDVGAGVVERYYGTASSAPNSAFGILWRLHQHHLKKISRTGNTGRAKAEAMKQKIEEIAALFRQTDVRFPPQFPRSFDMQAQGRFALGFYQQKASDRKARRAYLDTKKSSNETDPTAQDASENDIGSASMPQAEMPVEQLPSPDDLTSSNTSQGDSNR